MKYWRVSNDGPCLVIQGHVLEVFKRYRQTGFFTPESGGILLGYVRDPHIEILVASEPTRWDKRLRCFFDRKAKGHQELAQRYWTESGGLIRYVGEWHTHPEDYPTPSSVDREGWTRLARNSADKRPVLGIIIGRVGLHVELVTADGSAQVMAEEAKQ